jgi:hypothetical protein
MRIGSWCVAASLCSASPLLAAAALSKSVPQKSCDENARTAGPEQRRLTQYIRIEDCWGRKEGRPLHNLNDLYGKWTLRFNEKLSSSGFYRNYADEKRNALQRLVSGTATSTVVSTRLFTLNPSLSFTVPLLSVSYEGRSGNIEAFATTLTQSSVDQPYFRLTAATAAKVELSAKISRDSESRYAAALVSAVQQALNLAVPQSTLLTRINSDDIGRASGAIDSTLSRLGSESTSETASAGNLIEHWHSNSRFRIHIHVPRKVAPTAQNFPPRRSSGAERKEPESLDNWLVFDLQLTCPRHSMFSDRDICDGPDDQVAQDITDKMIEDVEVMVIQSLTHRLKPQQVVDFELAPGVTIRQRLTSADFFQRYLRSMSKLPREDLLERATFCESVVNELYRLGLSSLDARIGLWALVSSSGDFGEERRIINATPSCAALLPGRDWQFVPADHGTERKNATTTGALQAVGVSQ